MDTESYDIFVVKSSDDIRLTGKQGPKNAVQFHVGNVTEIVDPSQPIHIIRMENPPL